MAAKRIQPAPATAPPAHALVRPSFYLYGLPARRCRAARFAGVLGVLLGVFACSRVRQPAPEPPTAPMAAAPAVSPYAPVREVAYRSDADVLGPLLAEARAAFAGVNDYSCTLVKRERVGGRLLPEQTAVLLARREPFSVCMRFTAPAAVAGQEVCYVAGRHGGKMRVRGNGLKAAFGFVTLAVDDPRALAQSRHTIAEAGLGNLIDQAAAAYSAMRGAGLRCVAEAAQVDGRPCTRVVVPLADGPGRYAHRLCICFDRNSRLPVRFEAYDQPTAEEPAGALLESYTYAGLTLNPGLSEATFAR